MQIAVAVLVAILGIVNTLTVSITDRRRELGVLRAVGGLHGQIRRTIWIEALSVGSFGLVLGLALRRDQSLLHPADRAPRHRRACGSTTQFPVQRSLRAGPDHPGGGIRGGASGRRSRRCADRSWRRSSMNSQSPVTRRPESTASARCRPSTCVSVWPSCRRGL